MITPALVDKLVRIREALEEQSNPQWERVFDSLKSKQKVRIAYKGGMSSNADREMIVGRRSKARRPRWWVENITLKPADGSNSSVLSKVRLWKAKDGRISLSLGDMAVTLTKLEKA